MAGKAAAAMACLLQLRLIWIEHQITDLAVESSNLSRAAGSQMREMPRRMPWKAASALSSPK